MPGATLKIMRNLGKMAAWRRRLQLLFSALLLVAFFQPWVTGLGGPATALQLRDRLEGPRQLSSIVTQKGRIARDYKLTGRLWMLGAAEGAALASALWPALTAWPGLLAGAAATGVALWARGEIATYPFQHSGRGVTLTLWCGIGLTIISLWRHRAERKR